MLELCLFHMVCVVVFGDIIFMLYSVLSVYLCNYIHVYILTHAIVYSGRCILLVHILQSIVDVIRIVHLISCSIS